MKKSKLTEKSSRVASPFDTTSHKTERTANQKAVEWINQIIKDRNLSLGIAEQANIRLRRILRFQRPNRLAHPHSFAMNVT